MKPNDDNEKQGLPAEQVKQVLDAYIDDFDDKRFTSQNICDNLRETLTLTPDDVTAYMLSKGYRLFREFDRLVWVKK